MDFNTFLDHFDTIAEAPGGIAKLKALILDLAVRGKLVPQNSEDEPAHLLLKRVWGECQNLIEQKQLKKEGGLPPISEEEIFHAVPENWVWTRLGKVIHYTAAEKVTSEEIPGNAWLLNLEDIEKDTSRIIRRKTFKEQPSKSMKAYFKKNDVLYGKLRPYLNKVVVADDDGYCTTEIVPLKPYSGLVPKYVMYVLKRSDFLNYVNSKTYGINLPRLSTDDARKALFPLPPLAEQKRIVEKVDELMALCDRLAAAKQTRDDLRQKLRGSAIAALMNAETDEELGESWAIVRDNWHSLSQDPKDVDDLRKIILRLAIRGKLVQQEVNDEPAEKLLKVIADKQSAHPKKFRKPKDLSSIEDVEKPFELPFGWCWCRFTEIGQLERGKSKHRPRNEPALYASGSIPLVQTGDVARAKGVITTYTALYNEQGLAQSRLWPKGTLCITIAANIADSAMLGFDACFPDSVVGFVPTEPISDSRYFEFFIRTMKSTLEAFAPSTAQKNINLSILDEVLIPLPPLAEQKRIVAKVDELTQMCDQLEESLRRSQQRAEALAASAISHLTI